MNTVRPSGGHCKNDGEGAAEEAPARALPNPPGGQSLLDDARDHLYGRGEYANRLPIRLNTGFTFTAATASTDGGGHGSCHPDTGEQPQPVPPPTEEDDYSGLVVKVPRSPSDPTPKEREEHEATQHLPFRSWCPCCVSGRANANAKSELSAELEHGTPTVSVDYFYLGGSNKDALPCLAKVEHRTRAKICRVVPGKGAIEQVAQQEAKDLKAWGAKRFIFKSDQESSLVALKARVAEILGSDFEVTMEVSPVDSHRSNGTIERAIQAMGGMVRTLKLALEKAFQWTIDPQSPIMHWLVLFAGYCLTRYEVGSDGRTPYERSKGKRFRTGLPTLGEKVFYRPIRLSTDRMNKSDPKFLEGIFLGCRDDTLEYYIGGPEGVCRSTDLHRLPPSTRYDLEALKAIRGTPYEPTPGVDGSAVPLQPGSVIVDMPDVGPLPPDRGPGPCLARTQNFSITQADLREHGWTRGCPRCEADLAGKRGTTKQHTTACRARFEELLRKTEAGRARLTKVEERRTSTLADYLRDAVAAAPTVSTHSAGPNITGPTGQVGAETRATSSEDPHGSSMEVDSSTHVAPSSGNDEVSGDSPTTDGAPADVPMDLNQLSAVCDDLGARCGVVHELYGPGKIGSTAEFLGMTAGRAFDLRRMDPDDGQPWDLSLEAKRRKAEAMIEEDNPDIVVGSPPCGPFSQLQSLNRERMGEKAYREMVEAGIQHLAFCARIYLRQRARGKYFLHEHPWGAWSWMLDFMQAILEHEDVFLVRGDQCAFGQAAIGPDGKWGLARKSTGWMTNAYWITTTVGLRCSGDHEHVKLIGGRAKATERYPPALDAAIVEGLLRQLKADRRIKPLYAVPLELEDDRHETDSPVVSANMGEELPDTDLSGGTPVLSDTNVFYDDVSGCILDPAKVRAA